LTADLTRVVVVGTSCSGKTTFARQMAMALGSRCVELDSLHWGPHWTPRPDFRQDVQAVTEQPRWVIDGNYSSVRDIVWQRCTAIVWLDYSFARVFSRALRRTVRRVVGGERLYGGNRETIGTALFDLEAPLWLVVRTHGQRRRELPELFRRPEYGHVTVIRLRTPAAAQTWLGQVSASLAPGSARADLGSRRTEAGCRPGGMTTRVRDYTPLLREAITEAKATGHGAAATELEETVFAAFTTSSEMLQEQGLAIGRFLNATRGTLPRSTREKLTACLIETRQVCTGWRKIIALLRRRRF
jgi:adenylate kinase family enzyme